MWLIRGDLMRFWLAIPMILLSARAMADPVSIEIEKSYNRLLGEISNPLQFMETLQGGEKFITGIDTSMLAIDALWNLSFEDTLETHRKIASVIEALPLDLLSLGDKVRAYIVFNRIGSTGIQGKLLRAAILGELERGQLDKRSVLIAYTHREFLKSEFGLAPLERIFANQRQDLSDVRELERGFQAKSSQELRDLVFKNHRLAEFRDGNYLASAKVFMFCRRDRNYPCRFIIKNRDHDLVKDLDGKLWTQPALGQSSRGLPYDVTNGYTPSGVYTIDSVMPSADNQTAFGSFRRMILNFVPKSTSESELKLALPELSINNTWWKESVVARDVGRNSLRIHGTGKYNSEPESTYYPHIRTSGCVSQLEGKYASRAYKDQRSVLDVMMKALGLTPRYENERSIKGMLYVIEVDDSRRSVQAADIVSWLGL